MPAGRQTKCAESLVPLSRGCSGVSHLHRQIGGGGGDDGEASVFADVTYQVYSSPFEAWQFSNFVAGSSDPNSLPGADPDLDGWKNLAEYGLGTNPKIANPSPITYSLVSLATERYFRVVIPKNPAATDVQYGLEYHDDPAAPTGWSSLSLLTEQNTSTNLVIRDGPGIAEPLAILSRPPHALDRPCSFSGMPLKGFLPQWIRAIRLRSVIQERNPIMGFHNIKTSH